MKRVKVIAYAGISIIAIISSITLATARGVSHSKNFAIRTFGVLGTTSVIYTVIDITGTTKGVDYNCNTQTKICTFHADGTHIVGNRIGKSDVTITDKTTDIFTSRQLVF